MARLARVVVPGLPYHVTQRGNGRRRVFFSDSDYAAYRDWLAEAAREARVSAWAWCLMPSHVHLILVPQDDDGLRRALARVHRRYASHIHGRRKRTGHFWQGRFGAVAIDEDYLGAALRYVALNPVRARLVSRARDWRWSSARAHLRRRDDKVVTPRARARSLSALRRSDEEIALGNDLRAAALMNLGTVEAWSLALEDAERHLQEGAILAREMSRPYLELGCLAQLGFASKIGSLATAQWRCREAIALAERHGWGAEPVIAPALVTLAEKMIWMGEFGEGERWLQRAARALEADDGPGIRLRLHLVTGMLYAGRGCHQEALEEFSAAGRLQPQLVSSLALASQVTGWTLATQGRLGMAGEARASLTALADEKAGSGEIRNARAVICLADGDPARALGAVQDVLDGTAPVIGYVTVVEAQLLAGWAPVSSVTSARRTRPPNARWLSRRLTGWCCRSR